MAEPTPGTEISTLDFESIIGGPLVAIVNAQAQAAMSTADFIKNVGFTPITDSADGTTVTGYQTNNVTFQYTGAADDGGEAQYQLTVPLLTIVPIPYLRVEEATLDFNVKITSITTRESSTAFGVSASASTQFVNLKVATSYQKTSTSGESVERTYSMVVHVKAVQDEMPGGLERVLGILEDQIVSKAVSGEATV